MSELPDLSDMTAKKIAIAPDLLAALQTSVWYDCFSVEDLVDRILRCKMIELGIISGHSPKNTAPLEVSAPTETPASYALQDEPITAEMPSSVQLSAPTSTQVSQSIIEKNDVSKASVISSSYPKRPSKRFTLPNIPDTRGAEIASVTWIDDDLAECEPIELLSQSLFRMCKKLSASRTQDIEIIRQHIGIEAGKGKAIGRLRHYDEALNIHYGKPNLHEAIHGAWRAARAMGEAIEIALNGPEEQFILEFDPSKVVAPKAKDLAKPVEVKAGCCVRILYEDNHDLRAFYIMRRPDDPFVGENIEKISAKSALAEILDGCRAGDDVDLAVAGHEVRKVRILEAWIQEM